MTARVNSAESLQFSAGTVKGIIGIAGTLFASGIGATWYLSDTLHRIENGIADIRRDSWTVRDATRYHNELTQALKTVEVEDGHLVIDFPPPYPPNGRE